MDIANRCVLKQQRTRLDQAIAALEGLSSTASRRGRPPKAASASARPRPRMSAAARNSSGRLDDTHNRLRFCDRLMVLCVSLRPFSPLQSEKLARLDASGST